MGADDEEDENAAPFEQPPSLPVEDDDEEEEEPFEGLSPDVVEQETEESDAPAGPNGFVPVTIDISAVPRAPREPRHRYWLGVTDDAPFDRDTRGGVEWTKYEGPLPLDDYGRIDKTLAKRHPRGHIMELTDSQVELIKERVANSVLRLGRGANGKVVIERQTYLNPGLGPEIKYEPQANDCPRGYFLYMVRLSDKMPPLWREGKAPRMTNVRSMEGELVKRAS